MKDLSPDEVLSYLKNVPRGITFIHGKAGSGKTTLIQKLASQISGCQILTPTNFAASLYKGARTIHSFFYAALDKLEEGYQNPNELTEIKAKSFAGTLQNVRMLIIDEISMVRADLFEMMHQICRKALGKSEPFGGIPLVLVGDLFQLPPIVSDEAVLQYLNQEYGGIYFFDSHIIRDAVSSIKLFELTKSYRQEKDPEFVRILDAFRYPMSPQRKLTIMKGINSRVTTGPFPEDAIYVASSNEEVCRVNTEKLSKLPGEIRTLEAEYSIQKLDGNGHVTIHHSDLPVDEGIREIIVPSAYDSELQFKIGAKVVICKNSRRFGYVNGDFGTIKAFNGEYFTIELDKGTTVLCPNPLDKYRSTQVTEYRYDMEYDAEKHRLVRITPYVQKTTQFPIKLAYAFTIHKAQGQTYDKVILDLNSHIFAPGQLYVALSRARSLQGLFLTKPITYSDIISDETVLRFLTLLRHHNGLPTEDAGQSVSSVPVHNETSDRFADVVRSEETSSYAKECIICALNSYNTLVAQGEKEKAGWELGKIVDIILQTYQSDESAGFNDCLGREDLTAALQGILDIYTHIVHGPKKQYLPENRVLATRLE